MQKRIVKTDPGYTGTFGWGQVRQRPLHSGEHNTRHDIDAYHQQAFGRTTLYDCILGDLAFDANVPLIVTAACIKSSASALRKMWDAHASTTGNADAITDYLRASFTVPHSAKGVKQLGNLIEVLTQDPRVVAFKDQFWKPNAETGYRSFKALVDVDGHVAELKVEYGGMEHVNNFTEGLRNAERALREAEQKAPNTCGSGKALQRIIGNAKSMEMQIREFRKDAHEAVAQECGLNALLSPALQKAQPHCSLTNVFKKVSDAFTRHPFGAVLTRVAGTLDNNEQGAVPRHPTPKAMES